jgi:hypothetical protein
MNHVPTINRRIAAVAVAAAVLVGIVAGAETPAQARSEKLRQQIDALLAQRRRAEPLPVDPPNPFVMQSPVMVNPARPAATPGSSEKAPATPAPDPATTLARFASELRISGMIRLNEQVQIIINDNAWKEGDFLTIERGGRVVRLQIARIQPGQLTLRLADAELVIRF